MVDHPRRIVFLDFDGVLNRISDDNTLLQPDYWENPTQAEHVARLERLVARAQAKVVISSSWRARLTLEELRATLRARGFTGDVIGTTPRFRVGDRSLEIAAWLSANPGTHAFAILDDDQLANVDDRLVLTHPEHGLTDADVEAALKLLLGQG